ncbi:SDR family oxidoreductase [Lacibacterium aquatile]|uniref:SDR family oxidoreductase n=1 Tax=Lacibacterium aquatile TaxID=1168082 RepID=A0ABW5DZI9_9PROT
MSGKIVISGAGGQLGQLVAQELKSRGVVDGVTLASRDPSKIAALGFKTARADFDDAASLAAAYQGADVVLILSGDAPNEVRTPQHYRAIDAAKAAGVKRIVYTSFTNATYDSLFDFAKSHTDTEAYLKKSGLAYTVLRNNQYIENLNSGIAHAKDAGVLAQPGATGKVAYLRRADVAAALVGAILGTGHEGKVYEITGPKAYDLFEIAAILTETTGRKVEAVDADPQQYGAMLSGFGLPDFLVKALLGIHAAGAAGEMNLVSGDAEKLAGRKIVSLEEHLRGE